MEDFKLELDRSDENTVFYEIHPADLGRNCGPGRCCRASMLLFTLMMVQNPWLLRQAFLCCHLYTAAC